MNTLDPIQCDAIRENYWCGRLHPSIALPIAEPQVIVRNGERSIVMAVGVLNQITAARLAAVVLSEAKRPETRIVYVLLGIIGGRLGSLSLAASLLDQAKQHAGIVAYLQELAWGQALRIAYACDLVFASPTCRIGWLECFGETSSQFDSTKSIDMVLELAALNRRVDAGRFARLLQSGVTGEQAEAMGIVVPDACRQLSYWSRKYLQVLQVWRPLQMILPFDYRFAYHPQELSASASSRVDNQGVGSLVLVAIREGRWQ